MTAKPPSDTSVSTSPEISGRISYEEFLRSEECTWAEWIDGEVLEMTPPSVEHQLLADFLTALTRLFVEEYDLGMVASAPCQMKLARSGREPDVLFVARDNVGRVRQNYIDGPADLAIEIVSEESRERDPETKFEEYREAGVREYWLIDPIPEQADFYSLGDDGRYEPLAVDEEGILRSRVLDGLWLNVDWLFRQPLPKLRDILEQWGMG